VPGGAASTLLERAFKPGPAACRGATSRRWDGERTERRLAARTLVLPVPLHAVPDGKGAQRAQCGPGIPLRQRHRRRRPPRRRSRLRVGGGGGGLGCVAKRGGDALGGSGDGEQPGLRLDRAPPARL
jgi:hypothetical protein